MRYLGDGGELRANVYADKGWLDQFCDHFQDSRWHCQDDDMFPFWCMFAGLRRDVVCEV